MAQEFNFCRMYAIKAFYYRSSYAHRYIYLGMLEQKVCCYI